MFLENINELQNSLYNNQEEEFDAVFTYSTSTEPIVLVILKSACFLIHTLLPRDLLAQGLKSARSEKREVLPRAVKSARYPVLLGKSRTFDKIV
jgi:hypothetical protein